MRSGYPTLTPFKHLDDNRLCVNSFMMKKSARKLSDGKVDDTNVIGYWHERLAEHGHATEAVCEQRTTTYNEIKVDRSR